MNWKVKLLVWWATRVVKARLVFTGPEIVFYAPPNDSFYKPKDRNK